MAVLRLCKPLKCTGRQFGGLQVDSHVLSPPNWLADYVKVDFEHKPLHRYDFAVIVAIYKQ